MKLKDIASIRIGFVKKGADAGVDYLKGAANDVKEIVTPKKLPEPIKREMSADEIERMQRISKRVPHTVTVHEETSSPNIPDTGTEPMPKQVNNQSKGIQNPPEEEPSDKPAPQKTDIQQTSSATETTAEQVSETVEQDTSQKVEPTVPKESPKPNEPSDKPAPKDNTKNEKKEEEPNEQPKEEKSEKTDTSEKQDDGAQSSETKATSGPVFTKDEKLMGTKDENGNLYMPDEISGSGISASAKQHKYSNAYKNATEWGDKAMAALEKMKSSMSAEDYEKVQKEIQEKATQYQKDFEKMRADPSEIHAGFTDYVMGNPHASLTVGGGATMGAVVLGLSDSRGQLTNQQLYGQDDLT